MKFFNPTADLKELLLLQCIEKNPDISQQAIAKEINAAVSMVNVYMNKLEEKGHLIKEYQSSKVVHYHITAEGMKRKNYLSLTYFQELLALYNLAEKNIEIFLDRLEEKGYKNVLFYGAGEVADTILTVTKKRKSKLPKVLALIDDHKNSKNKKTLGYDIISRDEIKDYDPDGIVITSYSFEDQIKERLEEIDYPEEQIELFFSEL